VPKKESVRAGLSWRLFAALILTAATALAVVVAAVQGLPPLHTLVVFGALMVYSELKSVDVRGASISPGWMIGMAAVVAFSSDSLLGPLLIGMLAGIELEHVRSRAWSTLCVNVGMLSLAMFAAAVAFGAVESHTGSAMPGALLGPIAAALAYEVVLMCVFVAGSTIRDRLSLRQTVAEFLPSTAQLLSFSFVGYMLGRLYVEFGVGALLLSIVPILIAREMFASYTGVKEAHEETVGMLIRALEQKDRYTAGHAERVAGYARYMGEELSFMPARLERLRFAALMHDIGKLVVPNTLLNKPGRLTEEEFAKVRIHEKVSVQMLSHIDFLRPIAAASHSDHTTFDPDDPDHPIEPYIVMIADAYDAMTSTRAYRKALPQDVAFQELRDKAGTQFHPECVEALIRAIEARGEKHGAGHEAESEFADAPTAGVGSAGLGDLLSADAQ
jgi:hypothetical protein